ncbi:MAG TPA: hypothetical protein VFW66_06235 [Gemmatimonadales bacterium]|nr:hypothetical protein [Gemmatimonadales bacterium]
MYALLVVEAALLEPRAARRWAAAALVPFALGVAAFKVAAGAGGVAVGRAGVVVDGGLLLVGVALAIAAIRLAGRGGIEASEKKGETAASAGLGAGQVRLAPLAAALLGTLATVFAGRVSLVFAGLVVAAAAGGWWLDGHRGVARALAPALVITVLLGPLHHLMTTIAGPVGLRISTLANAPFSDAAEVLIALPLALAVWLSLGLWPVHELVPGAVVAPAAVVVWVRVGMRAVPAGLEHWQPLTAPLAMLGIWHAAATRRRCEALAGLALLALASLVPGSTPAAALLVGASTAVGLDERGVRLGRNGVAGLRAHPGAAARAARIAVTLAAGWGMLLALEAGLRTQVVYTVLAAAGLACAAMRSARDPTARTARAR